jgi:hypothetical protein
MEGVRRWDVPAPNNGSLPVQIRGSLDVPGERITVESVANEELPISGRVSASRLLSGLDYSVGLSAQNLPVGPVLALARHLGAAVPADLEMSGTIEGEAGYTPDSGWGGSFAVSEGSAKTPSSPPVTFERAQVAIQAGQLRLEPAVFHSDRGERVEIAAELTGAPSLEVRLTTSGMAVGELSPASGRLLGASAAPVIGELKSGVWRGNLKYIWNAPAGGAWSGQLEILNGVLPLAGLAAPVRLGYARAAVAGERVNLTGIRGSAGDLGFEGEYRYEPGRRPHRFRLFVSEVAAADLERLLLPSLHRRRGFLARTLRLAAPVPEWLSERHAAGTIRIEALEAPGVTLSGFSADVLWDGARVRLSNLAARVENGSLNGEMVADLTRPQPAYSGSVNLKHANWRGGKLDWDGKLASHGIGADLVANLSSEGCVTAHEVTLGAEAEFDSLHGCYDFAALRLKFPSVEATSGGAAWAGQGSLSADGRLVLDLNGHHGATLKLSFTPR